MKHKILEVQQMLSKIPSSALIVREPHASLIVQSRKSWELRSVPTQKREVIGIIAATTGTIIGTVRIADCLGPLSKRELDDAESRHHAPAELRREHPEWVFAWVLENARQFDKPIPYDHPLGAQSWVNIPQLAGLRLDMLMNDKRLPGSTRKTSSK